MLSLVPNILLTLLFSADLVTLTLDCALPLSAYSDESNILFSFVLASSEYPLSFQLILQLGKDTNIVLLSIGVGK